MNLKEFKILENYCKASDRGFDSYSPYLVGKGLGVRFFALYFTQLRTARVLVPCSTVPAGL
jgi:hypothetical protein